MNLVRAKVRLVQTGQSSADVLEILGNPDQIEPGLTGRPPELTERQINDLGSIFFQVERPVADETYVYFNPYREGMTHRIAFYDGKVVEVWETR